MVGNTIHDQLLERYEDARKRHRQLFERFMPAASYGHGQRFEIPAQRPSADDLAELARRFEDERAAHRAWLESFGYRG